MIRLLLIWNGVLTALIAILLLGHVQDRLHKTPIQASSTQVDVIRVRRVEIVDQLGNKTAELGEGADGYPTALNLFDSKGRKAVILEVNQRGYGMLYFQAKHTDAKVTVGYFTGSDQEYPLSEEDPGGGWGVRVLRPGFEAPQVFGVQGDGRTIPTSR